MHLLLSIICYCYDVHLCICMSVHPSVSLGQVWIVIIWCTLAWIWAPWHQGMSTYSQLSISNSTWKAGGVWRCKLDKELNTNNDK